MYFFDTYAIIEILNGNQAYSQFHNETIITSILNFGELYYVLLKNLGKAKTDVFLSDFKPDFIEFDSEIVKQAMDFRHTNIKKKMSMVDCIGYMLALKKGLFFLTGDDAFKDLPRVKFIK